MSAALTEIVDIDLGVNYSGFTVHSSIALGYVNIDSLNVICLVGDYIHDNCDDIALLSFTDTPAEGVIANYTVSPKITGLYKILIKINCKIMPRVYSLHGETLPYESGIQDVLLFNTPLTSVDRGYYSYSSLIRILSNLKVRYHFISKNYSKYIITGSTLVLWGDGLLIAEDISLMHLLRMQNTKMRIILFADALVHDSITYANKIAKYLDLGSMFIYNSSRENIVVTKKNIALSSLTTGVRLLIWPKPLDIQCSETASIIVSTEAMDFRQSIMVYDECKNIIMISASSPDFFSAYGWPYDNGRLIANILSY